MKRSFFYAFSSLALSAAIIALAAPASAQGRRPGGQPGGGSDRPRQSMQQSAPTNRSDRSSAPQARPQVNQSNNNRSSVSQPRPQVTQNNNRPSYSPSTGGDNRPRGGGNHGGGNNGGGRNYGNDNKGYQNQRPNATPGRPENNSNYNNRPTYQPGDQNGKGTNGITVRPGNGGNNRPGGNNGNGGYNRPSGNDRPGGNNPGGNNPNPGGNNGNGGNVNPGNGNNGGGHGGNNGGGNYRPGNDRPGSGHGGGNNGGGNYRPGNDRPGGGHGGGNYRPGNDRPGGGHGNHPGGGPGYNRPGGGPHHGGINHGGPRPDYNRYRWHSSIRPRGPYDRWYDYYRYNRWSWRTPIAPPYRIWRPTIVWYYRPIIPTGYRFYASAPIISGVLGIEFGTYLDASLNYLYYNGYDIDGYQDNVVYLRDVNMMGYSWPDVLLQYDNNGGMCYAEFVTSASYQDDYRFRSLYNSLCSTFGTPINSGNGYFSWYGRNGNGYVNLNTVYENGRYFTVLTFGV